MYHKMTEEKALKIAERNLTTGNWELETAHLFLQGYAEYQELKVALEIAAVIM